MRHHFLEFQQLLPKHANKYPLSTYECVWISPPAIVVVVVITFKEMIIATVTTNNNNNNMSNPCFIFKLFITYVTSSSGPTRNFAPLSFAILILSKIRFRLPSKSSAHWLREQVAKVTLSKWAWVRRNKGKIVAYRCPIFTKYLFLKEKKRTKTSFSMK